MAEGLPRAPTPLVGRQRELEAAQRQLTRPDVRLLTFTGPGGAGKTRLALHAAALAAASTSRRAVFVDLAPVADPNLVLPAIAQTLHVSESAGTTLSDRVVDALSRERVLLLLDNFEHVLDAAAHLADLLARCPELQVVTTSRAALRLRWEYVFPVPPLDVPDRRQLSDARALAECPSVSLFVARARAARPGFSLSDANSQAVGELCVRLDGLPLAIELAAALCRTISPTELLARLGPLAVLTGESLDAPQRQRSMRNSVRWSYDLLSDKEQRVLRQLAVFSGGWTLDGAQAVASAETPDLLQMVTSLVDRSLARVSAAGSTMTRFSMLETIREFALDELHAHGELEEMRARHAALFLSLAEAAEAHLHGPDLAEWLNWFELEHDNLRATLDWLQVQPERTSLVRLVAAIWPFWWIRGHTTEGRRRIDMALARDGLAGDRDPLDDRWSYALFGAWTLAIQHQDFVAGGLLGLRALANAERSGALHQLGQAEFMLGVVAMYQADYPVARSHLRASLDMTARSAFALGNAWTLTLLGATEIAAGELAAARGPLEQSVDVHRTTGDKVGLGHSLQHLGVLAAAEGDFQAALAHLANSLIAYREAGSDSWLGSLLDLFAGIAAAQSNFFRAICLAGAAAAQGDAAIPPLPLSRPTALEFDAGRVRELVGEPVFADAWSRGQAMTLDAALAFALAPPADVGRAVSVSRSVSSVALQLTPREREVVTLLASGVSNRRLADELVITEGTAKLHVKHILKKLGLRSRNEVAAWALRHGLTCLAPYT